MGSNRKKNASRNMLFGWLQNILSLLFPFAARTVIIYTLGVNYLGLNSLFSSVLSVLNLAELGVGYAMTYSMYAPIAEKDNAKICALMRLYKIYYRIIGLAIAGIGISLIPLLPSLIKSDVPNGINIYILYFLNLSATVLSYWLFAYKNCLLTAHQRSDISSKISIASNLIMNVSQITVLLISKNYYYYLCIALVTQIVNNLLTAWIASRMFPEYTPKGILSRSEQRSINRRIMDLFTSKIGAVVVDSADTIVISAFLGLTKLALYQNYFFILTSVRRFLTVIFTSSLAGVGNSLIEESNEKNYNDLEEFLFIISWLTGICSCCFLGIYQVFMKLWVGDKYLLSDVMVVLFVVYFAIMEINQLLNMYKDAAGLWSIDKWRPLCSAVVNLGLNIFLVKYFELEGILISTIFAITFVEMPWLLYNLFTKLFERKYIKRFLKKLLMYILMIIIVCALNGFICSSIFVSGIAGLLIRLIISVLIPNLIFFVLFSKTKEFERVLSIIKNIIR